MEKAIIIYTSTHHGNTCKLVKAIANQHDIVQLDASKAQCADLSEYDFIGFASGISFGKFYTPVEQFLENNLPENKRVFFLYTCAKVHDHFTESIKAKALKKNAIILGEYGCRGFNTYGPLKIVGGMNKNHPSAEELDGAVNFFASILAHPR